MDLDPVSVYRLPEGLSRPVLVAHGDEDYIVPFDQYERFEGATRDSPLLRSQVFEDEGHGFADPANEQAWYDALLGFLAEHNPPD